MKPRRLNDLLGGVERLGRLAWVYVVISLGLRTLWLFRPDPFGHQLVVDPGAHVLQAFAFDVLQAALLALVPLAVLGIGALRGRDAGRPAAWLFLGLLVVAIVCSALDGEAMRFSGVHLSIAALRTYGNGAAVSEMPHTLAYDEGGPFLGVALVGASLPLSIWLMRRALRFGGRPGLRAPAFCVASLIGYAYLAVAPPNSLVRWQLATPVELVHDGVRDLLKPALTEADVASDLAQAQLRYRRTTGTSAQFPSARYPLLHVSPHRQCVLAAAGLADFGVGLDCQADHDGDGVPLAADCDDASAAIHPGATDVAANGIDEDCSGVDAEPWNVLLIVLESHRAVNVGHLRPDGKGSTPVLDRLAAEGTTYTRAACNGLPTIASFMTIQTGLLPHPEVYVATTPLPSSPRSLPETLREHGYVTRFFTAADPGWDNQTPWLDRWYDGWEFDKNHQNDRALFQRMRTWFQAEAPRDKPFFVMAMTRTNHMPFDRIEGVATTGGDRLDERIVDTMHYTDEALGELLASLAAEPAFAHTIVVVTGDHGFPLGEHGTARLGETAHTEAATIPIVIWGGHPRLAALRGRHAEPASHIDLAPTLLDLLGIEGSGAWMGRSLLGEGEGQAITLAPMLEWANERGARRAIVAPARWPAVDSVQLYDRTLDWFERQPLPVDAVGRALAFEAISAGRTMKYLYEADRLWPAWWTDGPVRSRLAELERNPE